jgi:hypothetical protein
MQKDKNPNSLELWDADGNSPLNLYASHNEQPLVPPVEDLNTSDVQLLSTEQEPRFPDDLYMPRWVRGHGSKREGWCGFCKPGR